MALGHSLIQTIPIPNLLPQPLDPRLLLTRRRKHTPKLRRLIRIANIHPNIALIKAHDIRTLLHHPLRHRRLLRITPPRPDIASDPDLICGHGTLVDEMVFWGDLVEEDLD